MLAYYIILNVFIFYSNAVYALDSCGTRKTCKECITDPNLCVWCATNEFTGVRCIPQSSIKDDWCPRDLENPSNFKIASSNEDFRYDSEPVIQMRPQKYKMKLRPGQAQGFEFSFKGAPDFPVDLYFLMDASKTMGHVKDMAAKQSENIYNTLKNMTKDVYLGYGTFVDKRLLPYTVDFDPEKTYSFRHRLRLNNNFTTFQDMVSNTTFGINRDPQEGGLDALAQVMVCTKLIGWRNESRKIIVFLTDGAYHTAGEGKFAGLSQPYDGKCYTQNNTYTKELEMDYPSVGMINKLAVERNIIILFYVEKKVDSIYRSLSSVLSGSRVWQYIDKRKSTGEDEEDHDDAIVRALKEIYEKISSTITFKTKITSGLRKNLQITFKPNCTLGTSNKDCDVVIGVEKKFMGTVKLLEYDGRDKVIADIVIESIGEKLTLEIDVIASCDCEDSGRVEENSAFCHGEPRICGECSCGDKRYGEKCACVKSENNAFNDSSTCIKKDSDFICSGHGSCVCGKCECRAGYSGTFCDCNEASCPRFHDELCSGNHGECMCGKCVCKPEWNGPACECPNNDCMENGRVCNNRGYCACGQCKCHDIAKWDKRKTADVDCKMNPCPECHNLQCAVLEGSALCVRQKTADECSLFDSQIQGRSVQTLTDEYLNSTAWQVCPDVRVDIGCYTSFVYRYDDLNYSLEIVVQQDRNCAETYYIFGGILLAVIIVVGVCTLVAWKLLTEARDRHEFMQFVNMSAPHQGVVVNPLYAAPTSKFDNPGFRKRSVK